MFLFFAAAAEAALRDASSLSASAHWRRAEMTASAALFDSAASSHARAVLSWGCASVQDVERDENGVEEEE